MQVFKQLASLRDHKFIHLAGNTFKCTACDMVTCALILHVCLIIIVRMILCVLQSLLTPRRLYFHMYRHKHKSENDDALHTCDTPMYQRRKNKFEDDDALHTCDICQKVLVTCI